MHAINKYSEPPYEPGLRIYESRGKTSSSPFYHVHVNSKEARTAIRLVYESFAYFAGSSLND